VGEEIEELLHEEMEAEVDGESEVDVDLDEHPLEEADGGRVMVEAVP